MVSREVTHVYEDPLDRIWIGCAERVGLRVMRDAGAYATTDGRGTLSIATDDQLDADDSLAQMIFHELCHSLIEGPDSLRKVDWGLDNVTGDHDVREHACLRLQAWLTRPLGLASVLAPTTDFRSFWDALGPDPLSPESDASVVLAKRAANLVSRPPWGPHVQDALQATAEIARVAGAWSRDPKSLWSKVTPARETHSTGFAMPEAGAAAAAERCGTCAWSAKHGSGRRCVKAEKAVRAEWAACERWEPELSCSACGACCREAFDTLLVSPRERAVRKHPQLVVVSANGVEIPRPNGLCPALEGAKGAYSCRIYEDRPRTCRDFTLGSANCLFARRRVGLSV